MRFEYIVVVASVALASAGSVAGLGGAFGDAIAHDAAQSHAERRDAPSAYVTSAQAGAEVLARTAEVLDGGSAFRRLPVALQRSAADAAALKAFLQHGSGRRTSKVHNGDFTWTRARLRNFSPADRAHGLAVQGDVEGVAREIVSHPSLAHADAGTASHATAMLQLAGQHVIIKNVAGIRPRLVSQGSVARGIRATAPWLPERVIEHFVNWATDWFESGAELSSSPGAPPIDQAYNALTSGNVRAYGNVVTRTPSAVDHGFATPLDELPAALRAWHNVTDAEAQSQVVRELMSGNLTFLQRQAQTYVSHVEEQLALWGDAVRPEDRVFLEGNVERVKRWERSLAEAEASTTLSKRQAFQLFDGAPGFEFEASRGHFESRLEEHDQIFPVASDTPRYWGYERVVDWVAADGALLVEVPSRSKQFDAAFGAPRSYAGHDHGHIRDVRARLANPAWRARLASLHERLASEQAAGASPAVLAEGKRYLGELIWEGQPNVEALANPHASYSLPTRRMLAQWYADDSHRRGDTRVADQAAVTLKRMR